MVGHLFSGVRGYLDGPTDRAQFDFPNDLVFDSFGSLYISEFNNHTIRKMTNGQVLTFAGNGQPGFADGIGTSAGLNQPAGLAIDAADNLYVTEWGSHRIRKVTPTGVVTTLAGSIFPGFTDGPGAAARFYRPDGIAVDPAGTLFGVENGNHAVRQISPEGVVRTIAGTGKPGWVDGLAAVAQFNAPGGLGITADGTLVIADTGNQRIRTVGFLTAPRVTVQPAARTLPIGAEISFTTQVSGSGPYTYQWRFNGRDMAGATGSGLKLINVQPSQAGNYSVTVRNPVAAVESAAITLSVVNPIRFDRTLPLYYVPGIAVPVRLETTLGATSDGGYAYAIEDEPPANWTVGKISSGGSYDPTNHRVKFGPFFDFLPRTLTYEATPPVGDSGEKKFGGIVSADSLILSIEGAVKITSAPSHPADVSPADQRISINEITAYASAWRRGDAWTVGPNPIPLDYVTRAGFLWKNGEVYRFDPSITQPPIWWVTRAGSTVVRLQILPSAGTKANLSTAIRYLGSYAAGDEAATVRVVFQPSESTAVYAAEESVPKGLSVIDVGQNGILDTLNRVVRWGPFFDREQRELTFRVKPSNASQSSFKFSGQVSWDGLSQSIAGDELLPVEVRIRSVRVDAKGELSLDLGEPDGLIYRIEASANLQNWEVLLELTNSTGTLRFGDSAMGNDKQRFYRATRRAF